MAEMLSEHFSVAEFEYSDTAKAYKINNKMNETQKAAVKHFCVYVLENIRKLFTEKYGKVTISITSGFRGSDLNKKVGGSNTSQHSCPDGSAAADIYVFKYVKDKKVQILPEQVYADVKAWIKAGKVTVDQLINEVSGQNRWTHIGTKAQLKDNRKQFLLYRNGTYSLDK